jgi:hypothetical protein
MAPCPQHFRKGKTTLQNNVRVGCQEDLLPRRHPKGHCPPMAQSVLPLLFIRC